MVRPQPQTPEQLLIDFSVRCEVLSTNAGEDLLALIARTQKIVDDCLARGNVEDACSAIISQASHGLAPGSLSHKDLFIVGVDGSP